MLENIVIEIGEYKMDIAPILNALIKFVKALLDAYLPEDIKDVVNDAEEIA